MLSGDRRIGCSDQLSLFESAVAYRYLFDVWPRAVRAGISRVGSVSSVSHASRFRGSGLACRLGR